MKNKLLLFLFPIAMSCSNKEIREIKEPFTGQLLEQYEVFENKEGSFLKDGFYKSWFLNGQIETNGHYKNNKKEGAWLHFYENGQLKSEHNYSNDTLHGEVIGFYENGKKKYEKRLIKGKPEGLAYEWFNTGQLSLESNYKDGLKSGVQKEYYVDGQIKSEINYSQDVKDGVATYWYDNGQKKSEGLYSNNSKSGNKWKYWRKDGAIWLNKKELIIGVWHNGEDSKREFFSNGTCIITFDRSGKSETIKYEVSDRYLKLIFGFMSVGSYEFTEFKENSFTIKENYSENIWHYTRVK